MWEAWSRQAGVAGRGALGEGVWPGVWPGGLGQAMEGTDARSPL